MDERLSGIYEIIELEDILTIDAINWAQINNKKLKNYIAVGVAGLKQELKVPKETEVVVNFVPYIDFRVEHHYGNAFRAITNIYGMGTALIDVEELDI